MFNMTNTISTFWKLGTTIALPGIYSFETFIAYPAGTHIFDPLKNDPIQIACSVDVITGKGELTTTMQVDKWNNVALGAIQKIRIPFKGDFLTVSEELNFSHIERAFSKNPNQHDHDNITQWLQIAVESVFNGTSFAPTQGGYPAANNMRWAANAGGFYDPSIAWQGVAGALAPLFKFVFNQVIFY